MHGHRHRREQHCIMLDGTRIIMAQHTRVTGAQAGRTCLTLACNPKAKAP